MVSGGFGEDFLAPRWLGPATGREAGLVADEASGLLAATLHRGAPAFLLTHPYDDVRGVIARLAQDFMIPVKPLDDRAPRGGSYVCVNPLYASAGSWQAILQPPPQPHSLSSFLPFALFLMVLEKSYGIRMDAVKFPEMAELSGAALTSIAKPNQVPDRFGAAKEAGAQPLLPSPIYIQKATSAGDGLTPNDPEFASAKESLKSLNDELVLFFQQLQSSIRQHERNASDLRDILNCSGEATLLLDKDFNIRFFTKPSKELFGLIDSDLGRPLVHLSLSAIDGHLLKDARSVLANLLPSRREIIFQDDLCLLRKIEPYRSDDGRVGGVVITFSDITEMKLVEREIRAARDFAESVVETVREPLLVFDEALTVNSVNKAFREFFQADAAEFVCKDLSATPARALLPLVQSILQAFNNGAGRFENVRIDIDIPHRGPSALMTTAHRIGGNADAGMICLVLEDITEREKVEQAFVAAIQALEQSNTWKSQFLAAASHDLRQPLQSLRLLCGILKRKLVNDDTLSLAAKLEETIDSMTGIVNSVLDINQLEAGAIKPCVQNFSVNMLLEKLFAEFDYLVQAKGLNWRVLKNSATLKTDSQLLLQIMRNLIINAIKFTSSGRLLVCCRKRGAAVRIEVWDSGPGIPQSDINRIFGFFQKGLSNRMEAQDGFGLGLAIVKELADILGLDVKVASRIGKGSRFSVLVPLGEQQEAQLNEQQNTRLVALNARQMPAFRSRGLRILIVEDETSIRESLELLFAAEGYVAAIAASAGEALNLIRSGAFSPEMIVVDYSLPGGRNGLRVIDDVRAATGRQIPAIVLTGDISSLTGAKIDAKATVHLTKPVRPDELLSAIREHTGIRIEAAPQAPVLTREHSMQATTAGGISGTVFLVDDDVDVRSAIRQHLESYGHRVVAYSSGREFVEAGCWSAENCLILDACMPEMDGFSTLFHVMTRPTPPPIIMITGQGDVQTAVRAMKAGASDFIEKPFDPDQLREAVERALSAATRRNDCSDSRRAAAEVVARLTKRQRAVLDHIVAGDANKVIANKLGIGQRTVESHRAAVMKKLGVKTFADLIRLSLAAN